MTVALTLEGVREAMKAVVLPKEDYVYRETHDICRYTEWRDSAIVESCLVGAVLHHMGVSLHDLSMWNDEDSSTLLDHMNGHAVTLPADEEEAEQVDIYLRTAQQIQDRGEMGDSWGRAYAEAERTL